MSNLVFPLVALGAYVQSREPYSEVRINEAASGKEYRSSWWAALRYKYKIVVEVLRSDAGSRADYQQFADFFTKHFGQLDSFLFVDPEDSAASGMGFGVGDGATTAFQLQRTQQGMTYDRLGGPWGNTSIPRSNYVTYSEQLDNAAWTKTSSSVTPNAAAAPDGTISADKLVEAAATAVHKIASANVAVTSGNAYEASFFVKLAERTTAVIDESLGGAKVTVDMGAGTITAAGGALFPSIVSCGNGWYRCAFVFVAGSSANTTLRAYPNTDSSYAGNGTSGIYLWGGSIDNAPASPNPTPYIATAISALTSTPSYWPAYSDGFEPVYDVQPSGLSIYKNGALQTLTSDYAISSTSLVTFTSAPASGAVLTWAGSYYRRVRVLNNNLPFARIVKNMWSASVDLISVKP